MDFPQKFRPEKHGTPENIGDQRWNDTLKTEKLVFLLRICQNGGSTKNRDPGKENRHES
jgi:hypothetical protein